MDTAAPSAHSGSKAVSDEQLIGRMQLGDSEAFAELYERYRRGVYEYCLRLLQDRDTAADATQNTFIKVHTKIAGLESFASFKAWLFTIARNEIYAYVRRSRTDGIENEDLWETESPHEELVEREEAELVRRFLGELKPEYREVLLLLEYEQMSYAEIASITGVSISAVESRIFRARKALAKKLREYM
jgi:RNA polymerase sigma-70 factor (ECF subfamily)